MLKNYLLVAIRNIFRQKVYSFINIIGFAVGLAVCLIMSFYVIDDLTYDKFHENAEYIYHLLTVDNSEAEEALSYSITSGPLVLNMAENIPEVEAATRLTSFGRIGIIRPGTTPDGEQEDRYQAQALVADESFFDVFGFTILSGNDETPLRDLHGVYITPEVAENLFGDESPVGQTIDIGDDQEAYVAGIVEECPTNSHLQYEIILPLDIQRNPVWWNSWENLALIGYFRINENADPAVVKSKLISYASEKGFADVFTPDMQRLLDVHLGSGHLRYDFVNFNKNDRLKVFTFGIIAILVLIIASINFINLSSARAVKRAREVGIRKVVGGTKSQLFFQFLGESVLITLIAVFIALILFEITLPYLNDFLQKDLSLNLIENYKYTFSILIISIIVGLLAGIYPATVLSGFNPIAIISGNFHSSGRGILLRRILVVGQFAVSIALIISVFIVLDQIQFLNSVDLGYSRDNILVVRNFSPDGDNVFREKIENLPYVESVSSISQLPGGTLVRLEVIPEGHKGGKGSMLDRIFIDNNAAEALEFKFIKGRNFSERFPSDATDAVIINESAMKQFGWTEPIGKTLVMIDENEARLERTVIGVVKDFNFTTTRRKVNSMVIPYTGEVLPRFLIKIRPGRSTAAREEIEEIFAEIYPDAPNNPFYLNEIFNFQFTQDRAFATNIAVFSGLAIIIASLGLFGLASYTTQQRQREVAIRKVLGSSMRSIVLLLTKEFTRWVILANLIAWPLAYFGMNKWLQNFIYRTDVNFLIFIGAGLAALIIAFLTVLAQTVKAAHVNPVEALKYE